MHKGIYLFLFLLISTLAAKSQVTPDTVKVDSIQADSVYPDSAMQKEKPIPEDSVITNKKNIEVESSSEEETKLDDKIHAKADSLKTDTAEIALRQKYEELKQNIIDSTKVLKDSIVFVNIRKNEFRDSLQLIHNKITLLKFEADSIHMERSLYADSLKKLQTTYDSLEDVVSRLRKKNEILRPLNKELSDQIRNLQNKVDSQSVMLDQQIRKIKEKEQLYAERELIYQNAIQTSKIDLVKLEGKLAAKNSQLSGKEREIELLAGSIADRKESIQEKNKEIKLIREKRENVSVQLDTLKDYLQETEKDLLLTRQELKYSKKEVKALKKRIHDMTNKEKTIRLVQGIGIRNYRSPLYSLKPESSENPDSYVITNENAGDYEFDFVTGATFKLFNISADDAEFSSDIGFFVGFGGKNLFKNFYIGPNLKLFDVIHINAGLNIAEFRLLKSGFKEGDSVPQGTSIPTISKWELTPYFGLTFDFSLITSIAGKL